MDERDREQAERIANYIKQSQRDPEMVRDLSKIYESLENLTKKLEKLEKHVYDE
jgi:hypothetical protein